MGLKPFFTYYGGKWRAAPHYPAPLHQTIIEPFAGSAGYSLRHFDHDVMLIDLDENIVRTWEYIIAVSEQEILGLPDLLQDQTVDDIDVCSEARLLIGWWLNKGTLSPCKSPGSWMRKTLAGFWPGRAESFWGQAIRKRIASQLRYIRHWKVTRGDFDQAPDVHATWFVDPPYRQASRTYRHGANGLDYSYLALWCQSLKGQVLVCEQEGAGWLPFEPWRHIKGSESSRGGKVSKEALWYRAESNGDLL